MHHLYIRFEIYHVGYSNMLNEFSACFLFSPDGRNTIHTRKFELCHQSSQVLRNIIYKFTLSLLYSHVVSSLFLRSQFFFLSISCSLFYVLCIFHRSFLKVGMHQAPSRLGAKAIVLVYPYFLLNLRSFKTTFSYFKKFTVSFLFISRVFSYLIELNKMFTIQ